MQSFPKGHLQLQGSTSLRPPGLVGREQAGEVRARKETNPFGEEKGAPLENGTRAFFEERFGYNFAGVRVYAGPQAAAQAAAMGAQAFTTGTQVIFNTGKYQPNSLEGRFLLAHELAHVVQQSGSPSSSNSSIVEDAGLEQQASTAALQVLAGASARLPAAPSVMGIQRFKISSGGFGKALDDITTLWTIPDATVKLFKKSPTFMGMVASLDKAYISSDEAMTLGYPAFVSEKGHRELDASGQISGISPTVDGKRVIGFSLNPAGASFKPAWNPNNNRSGDVIEVTASSNEAFVQEVIHEAAHATRFVTGANPAAATMTDEINVAIQDEIAARKTEKKALTEIPDPAVSGRASSVGSTVEREVQRDMAPAVGLTYLENIYFGRKLREQQKAEGISNVEAEEIARNVQASPDSGIFMQRPALTGKLSDFAWLCYKRERVIQDWKNFFKMNKPSDPDFAQNKEARLQAHVKEWMKNEVSYLP